MSNDPKNIFQIQSEIYTDVSDTVLASYPTCTIRNSFVYAPDAFPFASIVMSGDGNTQNTRDSSNIDKFNDITATVDVYTNTVSGKKAQAEGIMAVINGRLYALNFKMVSCKPSSNISNAQNYRLSATFTATVDCYGNIYARR